jgi:hypothetical protein
LQFVRWDMSYGLDFFCVEANIAQLNVIVHVSPNKLYTCHRDWRCAHRVTLQVRTQLTVVSHTEDRPELFPLQMHAFCSISSKLCLTQVDRWRHSVNDVVEYVTTEKVTRIYFQNTSCINTPVGNSNTQLGLYWLIISYVEALFLKERMNISDNLNKLRISHRMYFSHYKQNTCVSQI